MGRGIEGGTLRVSEYRDPTPADFQPFEVLVSMSLTLTYHRVLGPTHNIVLLRRVPEYNLNRDPEEDPKSGTPNSEV